jgi:hypothetical protein
VQYSLQSTRANVAAVNPTSGTWWQQFGVPVGLGDPDGLTSEGDEFSFYIVSSQLQSWMFSEINGEPNTESRGCTRPLATPPGTRRILASPSLA